ncbi:helix-turn-helix domain-containing protein [Burkholderia sp. 22PA0099]|uniref:AraC-like ligand-binding domain-containing protein n=1 Tax=Burkholderia sp. 22PA0099 TaxID=3237372 RepID=UPI0039C1064B
MNRLSFSTSSLAGTARANYWASLVCDTFVELDCDVPTPDRFDGRLECLEAGELQMFQIASSAHGVARTRSRIARSARDVFLLTLQTAGRGQARQGGRQAVMEPGDFTLVDTTRPYDLRFDRDFGQIVMRLPRKLLLGRLATAEDLTAQRVAGDRGVGRLASSYLRQIPAELDAIDPAYLGRVHDAALDLIATALGAGLDAPLHAGERHVALRRRILAYLEQHLSDPELNSESIAAAHGISARQLSRLFEGTGVRVSQRLWSGRIEQARRDLADPLRTHLSITRIGHDAGFKDAAHFSRQFKSALGETPRDFRARVHAGA